jgi:hypothetical protein
MYYTVTQGRARVLDRLNLLDRATYGFDWIVLDAKNSREAVRQWGSFKAGTHPFQAELEAEVARYRRNAPGYVPAWEAESEIVSTDIDRTLDAVAEQRRELEFLQAELREMRSTVDGVAARRRRPGRARRRSVKRRTRPASGRRAA